MKKSVFLYFAVMIKLSLKNYLKCLAHIFVPLGCIFLGVLFGAHALFGAIAEQTAFVKEEIAGILSGVETDFDQLWSYVIASARELKWDQPLNTVKMLLQGDWLAEKIGTFLGMTNEQYAQFLVRIQTVLVSVGEGLTGGLTAFCVWAALGVLGGYFVTALFVRRSTVKRGFWKFFGAALLESFFSTTIIAFTVWLLSVWSPGAIISLAVSMLVFGFVALYEAYLLHGRELKLSKVVNIKNCYLLQLSQLLIMLISFAVIAVLFAATNFLVALAIGFSVIIIAFLVSNVNAESYVANMAEAERAKNVL